MIHIRTLSFVAFCALTLASCSDYSRSDGNYALDADQNADQYKEYGENPFVLADTQSVSTFSVDADGGSYANVKRFILDENTLPPESAVRVEEFLNYFPMNYPDPNDQTPIALNGEVSECPWNTSHRLIRIGIKGKTLPVLPPANWVLMVDVSGSMASEDKLELAKKGLVRFVNETMRSTDKLAVVTYAGAVNVALPSTFGNEKNKIIDAIESLNSGGSTAGAAAIVQAYDIAVANKIENGNNRIIMITDGDFNVGISNTDELVKLVEEKRDQGIFLSTIGLGRGNFNEQMMEQIANNGNGTFEYIGDEEQAQKVFVTEFGKFYTVAKDVKVQVEFNPETVLKYRLIGYENRLLAQNEFEDDTKDAGEIGSGQNVTALYEIELVPNAQLNQRLFTVDFRYKNPDSDVSEPLTLQITNQNQSFNQASNNMRFSASVAAFGMLLKKSQYSGDATYEKVLNWLNNTTTYDPSNYRAKFIEVVKKASEL